MRAARVATALIVASFGLAADIGATPIPPLAQPGGTVQPMPPAAPGSLVLKLQTLRRALDGDVRLAVRDTSDGWTIDFLGHVASPQQSVSKLWVALAVFDAVDRGALRLTDTVTVRREDLTVFHQPIRAQIGANGFATTVEDLLIRALTKSDNTANDVLFRMVGGQPAVQRMILAKRLGAISMGPGEKLLQTRIAGLTWRSEYSFGQAFWKARDALPMGARITAIERYLLNPIDGATPIAIVDMFDRLARGELLTPLSTSRFLAILSSTETGGRRLKAGLAPGWRLAHKTGTGQQLGTLATGFNDVGLLTAPDGRSYAIAVMISSSRAPIGRRQQLMADVVRAVIAHHDGLAMGAYRPVQ